MLIVGRERPVARVVIVVDGDVRQVGSTWGKPCWIFLEGLGGDLTRLVSNDIDSAGSSSTLGIFDGLENRGT